MILADYYKTTLPNELKKQDLEYVFPKTPNSIATITRNGDQSWKNCKYLGTILDTQKDIEHRKTLATNDMTKLKYLWESIKVTLPTKIA